MSRVTRVAITPRFDSFHFGLFTCAACLGEVRGPGRLSQELGQPVFGDQAETEILIPAGLQSWHSDCWKQHCQGDQLLERGGA